MEVNEVKECPVCGHEVFSLKFFCEDYFVSHENFPIYVCQSCTFNFTRNIPGKGAISKYYEADDYISHSDTKKGLVNKIYHAVRKIMLSKKANILKKHHAPGTLLDVGCGTGYFAHEMLSRGWNVIGVEPSPVAADFASKEFGIEIKQSLFASGFHEKQFDAITLWHVLEHFDELNATLATLNSLLKNDGTVVIALPNVTSYDAEKYGRYWAAYDVPRHNWHFSPETFEQLISRHGFYIREIRPMPFDAFYIAMLSEQYKKSGIPRLRGLFTGIRSSFICLKNRNKSSSLIYVVKKRRGDLRVARI